MRSAIILIHLLLTGALGFAQVGFYADFEGIAQQRAVSLSWVIKAGNSCVDTYILRSIDNQSYDTVGVIGGLCGDDVEDLHYAYLDTGAVINRINYYRLRFGNVTLSAPIAIEVIDLVKQPYQLVYDASQASYTLYFANPGRAVVSLEIVGFSGQRLALISTTTNQFTWHAGVSPGFRLFVLRKEGQIIASGHLP